MQQPTGTPAGWRDSPPGYFCEAGGERGCAHSELTDFIWRVDCVSFFGRMGRRAGTMLFFPWNDAGDRMPGLWLGWLLNWEDTKPITRQRNLTLNSKTGDSQVTLKRRLGNGNLLWAEVLMRCRSTDAVANINKLPRGDRGCDADSSILRRGFPLRPWQRRHGCDINRFRVVWYEIIYCELSKSDLFTGIVMGIKMTST